MFEQLGTVYEDPWEVARASLDETYSLVVAAARTRGRGTRASKPDLAPDQYAMGVFVVANETPELHLTLGVYLVAKVRHPYHATIERASEKDAVVVLPEEWSGYPLARLTYAFDLRARKVLMSRCISALNVLTIEPYRGRLYAVVREHLGGSFVIVIDPRQADPLLTARVVDRIAGQEIGPFQAARVRDECLVLSGDTTEYRLCGEDWSRAPILAPSPTSPTVGSSVSVPAAAPSWLKPDKVAEAALQLTDADGVHHLALVWNDETMAHIFGVGRGGGESAPGIYDITDACLCFKRLPQSNYEVMRKVRWPEEAESRCPDCLIPTVREEIGSFRQAGDKIWFGLSHYDGEGLIGFGGIGSYDVRTRNFEIVHPPGVIDWSTSVLLVDGASIWVGLISHQEYTNPMGGLARYEVETQKVTRFLVPGVVRVVLRQGETVFAGTSTAICAITSGQISCFHIRRDRGAGLALEQIASPFPGVYPRSEDAPGP